MRIEENITIAITDEDGVPIEGLNQVDIPYQDFVKIEEEALRQGRPVEDLLAELIAEGIDQIYEEEMAKQESKRGNK